MIINFHEHASDRVERYMKVNKIDKSVLLPVGKERLQETRKMRKESPEKYESFYWIDIDQKVSKNLQDLEISFRQFGEKGIKFQPLLQHLFPNDRRLYPIYEKCLELEIPVLFHSGIVAFREELGIPHLSQYGDPIFGIDGVAHDFPDLKIVVAHMGGNFFYKALVVAEKHENIYMDTAYLDFFCERLLPQISPIEIIERGVNIIGANRILYGSEGLKPTVITESGLTESEKGMILGGNARRILGI
ncbi:MAG: amidohydrolase family protein [Clostridia bacterium]|nr:amidohydrolase family protein [Clostridia bacterium]